jgi:hypothetical protein
MAFLDETGLSTLRTRLEAVYERRDLLIGCIFWWSGSLASIPTNARLCMGGSLSKSSYTTLWNKIGYTYGGSGDTFYLPDFRIDDTNSSESYSRFIRARFKDIGSGSSQITLADIKQIDAIRNIKGQFGIISSNPTRGAISYYGDKWTIGSGSQPSMRINSIFSANYNSYDNIDSGNTYLAVSDDGFNPMAGHAVATDNDGGIRPYNISMIPIIFVS